MSSGRRPTGSVATWTNAKGALVFQARFMAGGRRRTQTLGSTPEWSREKAEQWLADTLADVRRGRWQPPAPRVVHPVTETPSGPDFHTFASEWYEQHRHEVGARTAEYWLNLLSNHLLPYFATYRLSEITLAEIERFRVEKIKMREDYDAAPAEERTKRRKPLNNGSINSAVKMLKRILEQAVRYELLDVNPADRVRRLKEAKPARGWLEPDQAQALLESAGTHRALIGVMLLAGLRVSEACDLRWGAVDLASGRLHVAESKTDAGRRRVDISPLLLAELKLHRANSSPTAEEDPVFVTSEGRPLQRHHVRSLLGPLVRATNAKLVARGQVPIAWLTCHTLRRTYCSLLYESGCSPLYVADQMGHTSPTMSLEMYAKVMNRSTRDTGARMDALISAQIGVNDAAAQPTVFVHQAEGVG